MSKGGKLYEATRATAESVGFYEHMRQIIPGIRAAGIKIFIVPHHRSREGDYDGWQHPNPVQLASRKLKPFAVDTWGGEWHPEFGPRPGDVIVSEHWAQSGFANTNLDQQLKQHGIQRIILVGFIANSCIESTGRFGMELGYHVTIVKDATAAFNFEGLQAAATNYPTFAHAVLSTAELLAALPQPAAS
jgi:nicotinamidase-related amidase